jgi:hypothetical protein
MSDDTRTTAATELVEVLIFISGSIESRKRGD